ncbi:MAG: shikimate dehydrogenase family protein [Solirubrobacteraceae bacterium]
MAERAAAEPTAQGAAVRRTRLGVLGWPVAHSRSPAMHNAALRAAAMHDWRYQLLPVPPALFADTALALPAAGFRAVNVTIPHKLGALALCSQPTVRARAIGAANTLVFCEDGTIAADNTDAPALIGALPFALRGRTALVLGAGGSARAAVWALLNSGAAEVKVYNRTAERAHALCEQLGGTPVAAVDGADLLVHCTPIGLHAASGEAQQLPLAVDLLERFGFVADFAYRQGGTELVNAARARGIGAVDGLELLVGQGALSFEQFTGRQAPVAAMRAAVGLPSL